MIWKMADDVDQRLEGALNTLLSITEKSGHLHKDLKMDIVDSVSTLRYIFVNLKNSAAEHMGKITQLENEVKTARAELRGSRATDQSGLGSYYLWIWGYICTYMQGLLHVKYCFVRSSCFVTYCKSWGFPSSVAQHTIQKLRMRPVHCLSTLGCDYPLM
jgi:hypothetical protein